MFVKIETLIVVSDEKVQLSNLLKEIESRALINLKKNGVQVILVIDDADNLREQIPGALELLQNKAKMWADWNMVRVIFVINDEETDMILQRNSSNWSRTAVLVCVDDLSREETIRFLSQRATTVANEENEDEVVMSEEDAARYVDVNGEPITHLFALKRKVSREKTFDEVVEGMKKRERVKFENVSRNPHLWKVISVLTGARNRQMKRRSRRRQDAAEVRHHPCPTGPEVSFGRLPINTDYRWL